MPKFRVYEIAKELSINNKDILEALPKLGITVKTHMSALEEDDVKKIQSHYSKSIQSEPKQDFKPAEASASKSETESVSEPRPRRIRPDGTREPRPDRIRPDGTREPRPDRIRPDGTREPRPDRIRPDGTREPRPDRIRPDGTREPRPDRIRPDGTREPRPDRIRPDGTREPRPDRIRPDGTREPRPDRIRPDGTREPRPDRIRPDGTREPRPDRIRPDGTREPRPDRIRPDGTREPRPDRIRPDGTREPRPDRIRPDGTREPRPDRIRPASTLEVGSEQISMPKTEITNETKTETLIHEAQQETKTVVSKEIKHDDTKTKVEQKTDMTTDIKTADLQNLDKPAAQPDTEKANTSNATETVQRPSYQGQDNRPPRSQDQRTDGYRPRTDGTQKPYTPRPQGQGGYTPRPQGQGYTPRPQGEGYTPRPQGQGYTPRPQGEGYTPRPQGQGYTPRPQGEGYTPRPQGQGYTPRPQGQGYTPRPQGEGYTPRPQGQGGYTPRPQGQGGYTPRPQGQGGYTPRPQGQGGYTPRPPGQGGYTPRPGGGGYSPRPGGGYNPKGGAMDKDRDPRDARPAQRYSKPAPATKTPQNKPDKFERQQKIEVSKRINKHDRILDNDIEKFAPKPFQKKVETPSEPKVIKVPIKVTVKELAEAMNKAGAEILKTLIKKGHMFNINNEIPFELAEEIAVDYNILLEEKVEIDILEETFFEEKEDDSVKSERPPVVVVMGHVDHGKTSLLDSIRKSDVATGEAGGITQHIGAYTVTVNGKPITFLDTPGHEAFTAMRMRGAQVTDIAILVVAADDGVMPQTIEAISHAKAAGVEIIVAINKIDKPSANPDRVKQELTEHGLIAEDWGGETICVPVSAATKAGIDTLLEMVLLVAELKAYKANPNKNARGTVIEALLDKGKGPVATVLVQDGTLQIGDPIVAGTVFGKIRAMMDDKGRSLKKAGPSTPVEILGLSEVPTAGDLFHVATNEKQARHVADVIHAKKRRAITDSQPQKVTLESLFAQIQAGNVKELNIIIKADVQGSVEAVKTSLEKLSNEEVRIRTILGGVGAVTESDVMLAAASNAIIIGFNVRPEAVAKSLSEENQVDIRLYRVIYNAIDDIQAAMKGMLDPIFEEKVLGHAEIRQIFKASSVGTIGGSYVTDGKFIRSAKVRIVRDGKVVYDGTLETLKRFKDDVKEVNSGYECGLLFTRFNDIKEGDIAEAYVLEEIKR